MFLMWNSGHNIVLAVFSFLGGAGMSQHSDKSHKNKKVVVIEKVRDKYGSVIALKVVLYRRHDSENGKVWDMKRSHTFSAAFSRRACREQAKTLARQWADKYGAKVVKRG